MNKYYIISKEKADKILTKEYSEKLNAISGLLITERTLTEIMNDLMSYPPKIPY